MRKILLLISTLFIFNSCFTDVVEDIEIKEINAKSIEELTKNLDFKSLKSVSNTTKFPILAWLGVPEKQTSIERFQEMKDAGINYNYSYYTHIDSLQKALDIAKQLDIKMLVRCPELFNDTENTVRRFLDHPANGGYHLRDEPHISELSTLKTLINKIESIDDSRFTIINLFPNQAEPHLDTSYEEYVNQFVTGIPLKLLSFDHYPIIGNSLSIAWYENLELIKRIADKQHIPFWAFALTTAHDPYPIPDINQLRLQVFSNLAYGAKGIQYFTYWTQVSKTWNFYSGPIEVNGDKTIVYDLIKQMNSEIQVYSNIFTSTVVTKVSHYGEIPRGTVPFTKAPYFIKDISIRGGNALLSEMRNGDNSFLMIQNTNLYNEIGLKIETDSLTSIILKNGYIIPAFVIKEEFKLTPGDIVLFMR
mgnify:CR=1 FL=1